MSTKDVQIRNSHNFTVVGMLLGKVESDVISAAMMAHACSCGCGTVPHSFEPLVFVQNGKPEARFFIASHAVGRGKSVEPSIEMVCAAFEIELSAKPPKQKKRRMQGCVA